MIYPKIDLPSHLKPAMQNLYFYYKRTYTGIYLCFAASEANFQGILSENDQLGIENLIADSLEDWSFLSSWLFEKNIHQKAGWLDALSLDQERQFRIDWMKEILKC